MTDSTEVVPYADHEGRATTKGTQLTMSRISRDFHLRFGANDYCVEVVRRGQFYEGYVSQVMKGDAFQFVEGSGTGRWFGALSDVRRLPGSRAFGGNGDLVFQFDGLEILQAAPRCELLETLPAPTSRKAPRLSPPSDVTEVEVKD